MKWQLKPLMLSFDVPWAISRNTSHHKINYIISLTDESLSSYGEVAPNIRYGETDALIAKQFQHFRSALTKAGGLEAFFQVLESGNYCSSLVRGLEQAATHFLCQRDELSLNDLLGTKKVQKIKTSFSLPILPEKDVDEYLQNTRAHRFDVLKVKVNDENAASFTNIALKHFSGKLRVDANEALSTATEVLKFCDQVSDLNRIEFLEQPMPSKATSEYIKLRQNCPLPLVADESVLTEVREELAEQFDGVNIKLMKSGSLFLAQQQALQAQRLGLEVMFGCMIETSLGISEIFSLAEYGKYFDLDGFLLIKEDPFQLINETRGTLSLKEL